jgi:hypothetical protein
VNFLHRDILVLQEGAAKERQGGDDVRSDIESNKGVGTGAGASAGACAAGTDAAHDW